MRTFDDHSLEFWSDVFQACRLASVDVAFEDFLSDPQRILQDFGMDDAMEIMESGFLPLLPKQARVRARLERLEPMCETPNGGLVKMASTCFVGYFPSRGTVPAAA